MNIFAIDPGCENSAYVLYDTKEKKIVEKDITRNINLVLKLKANCYGAWGDRILVLEQVACYGMPVGEEVFETVFWTGVFAEAWGGNYERITRGKIKMHLCQSMRAKDGNIRQALIDKLGAPGTKKAPGKTYGISKDLWAALAVAVTWAEINEVKP